MCVVLCEGVVNCSSGVAGPITSGKSDSCDLLIDNSMINCVCTVCSVVVRSISICGRQNTDSDKTYYSEKSNLEPSMNYVSYNIDKWSKFGLFSS